MIGFNEKTKNKLLGKLECNELTLKEAQKLQTYIESLEQLVEDASNEDFYGTQGWTYVMFGEE